MNFYASGKLLLFGEYLVLKGATCLAFPLKFGQSLAVNEANVNQQHFFTWKSKEQGKLWFSAEFSDDLKIQNTNDEEKAKTLLNLLSYIHLQKPNLFKTGLSWQTNIDFPRAWGLGTSSTLLSLLSQWSSINPYELLQNSFGGSGYDVACAIAKSPILFNAFSKETKSVLLNKEVSNKLLFIYSGQKQSSAQEIKRFDLLKIENNQIEEMNQIVTDAVKAADIEHFEKAITQSEQLLAAILHLQTLKNNLFNDYPYAIKSLGAWGGDFFMATYRKEQEARSYFEERGFKTQFKYQEIIKQ